MADGVTLPVRTLTSEAFAPYGRVLGRPERSHDAEGPGWQWWAETVVLDGDDRSWGVGYLELQPAEPRFDWAERHLRTLEAVIPVSGDCLLYVGPADHLDEPDRLPSLDRFHVFAVPAGSGVVLDRGVWHGAPLADGAPARAVVLILEGTGREDVTVVRFAATPVAIETSSRKDVESAADGDLETGRHEEDHI
jgi:ureidoglycolate lyase